MNYKTYLEGLIGKEGNILHTEGYFYMSYDDGSSRKGDSIKQVHEDFVLIQDGQRHVRAIPFSFFSVLIFK